MMTFDEFKSEIEGHLGEGFLFEQEPERYLAKKGFGPSQVTIALSQHEWRVWGACGITRQPLHFPAETPIAEVTIAVAERLGHEIARLQIMQSILTGKLPERSKLEAGQAVRLITAAEREHMGSAYEKGWPHLSEHYGDEGVVTDPEWKSTSGQVLVCVQFFSDLGKCLFHRGQLVSLEGA